MKKLWILDLDDTLLDNVHDYAYPILDSCRYIIKVLGNKAPHVRKIVEMQADIDMRRRTEVNPGTGKLFHYSMVRFPGSLVELYRTICRQAGEVPKKEHEEELYKIGLGAFDDKRYATNLKRGAQIALPFLYEQEDRLMILTRGDPEVQGKKIFVLRCLLGNIFCGWHIEECEKTTEVFERMASEPIDPGWKFYAVGNDYDKDIAPALQSKNFEFRGVYIPVETWETLGQTGKIKERMDKSRCRILNNLSEIVEKYEEL